MAALNHTTDDVATTDFETQWEAFNRADFVPSHDPRAKVTFTVADLRRRDLEIFSMGCVHAEATRRRLERLLGRERTDRRLRISGRAQD